MSWRDRFRTTERVAVTEVKKTDFLEVNDDLGDDEGVFMMCSIQAVTSAEELQKAPPKIYAMSFLGGDKILVTPGESPDDLKLYALSPRGGIEKVTAETAADKLDLLVPNMPFSNSEKCNACDKPFRPGDAVYSVMDKVKPRRDFCGIHVRFAVKYNGNSALAYSFQAADDMDKADPVVIWNMIKHVPQTLTTMNYIVRDVVAHARKAGRRGRLAGGWKSKFAAVSDAQDATLNILKFAVRRILRVQKLSLEEMTKTD